MRVRATKHAGKYLIIIKQDLPGARFPDCYSMLLPLPCRVTITCTCVACKSCNLIAMPSLHLAPTHPAPWPAPSPHPSIQPIPTFASAMVCSPTLPQHSASPQSVSKKLMKKCTEPACHTQPYQQLMQDRAPLNNGSAWRY